jgi:hypothetical protein
MSAKKSTDKVKDVVAGSALDTAIPEESAKVEGPGPVNPEAGKPDPRVETEKVGRKVPQDEGKDFGITNTRAAIDNINDLVLYGDNNLWTLLSKASSQSGRWMKSTKAMQLPAGVMIQVTTQQGDHVAEALQYVPGLVIRKSANGATIVRG